ncbi:MAG: hypothetical protein JXR42_00765 [Gammaproteobacteria bacterium]|nr:hypothetical protein [Gammaproteobacteria bacterium]
MTKIAFFLVSTAPYLLDYYHLGFYKKENSVRLVLCVREGVRAKLSASTLELFDAIYDVKRANIESYNTALDVSVLKEVITNELLGGTFEVARIFTYNEFNLPVAAELRELFGIEGHQLSDLERFKDKITIKSKLRDNNVRVPLFVQFDSSQYQADPIKYYQELVNSIGLPFILKPINTSGSFGVLKISSQEQFVSIGATLPLSHYVYEAEEYVSGTLYHCDAYFQNGECGQFHCSRYNYPLLEFGEGKNIGSIPLLQSDPIAKKLFDFHRRIYKILQPPDGITHTEIFISNKDDKCVFLENSLRAGGAYIIPMYERSFGVNLLSIDFSKQMDFRTYDNYDKKEYCFWASFPKLFGCVSKLLQPSVESRYSLEWHVVVGEQLQAAKSMRDKAAAFISWNSDYDALSNDFDYISKNSVLETQ